MVIPLSFLTLLSSLSIGMRKQLAQPQHSIHGANREVSCFIVYKALQEEVLFYVLSRTRFIKACLEGTSTIQYLVLRMRIHTRGWHAINTKKQYK